ncbi:MAG: 3'-5' exonuclease [Ignavibacteriae bacterium]|nr:3'-5' exonuclease [Ignavibacteriota bacterium]
MIVFFDIETTGTDLNNDKIVEIYLKKLPDNKILEYRINPGIPIPKAASDVHGITDKDVNNAPSFKDIAKNIFQFIDKCDLAGYNAIKFDIPFLYRELKDAGFLLDYKSIRLYDSYSIFTHFEKRTLEAAYKFYCNKELENAHQAGADVEATIEVFKAQLDRYGLKDKKEIALISSNNKEILDISGKFTYNDDGVVVFTFGNNKDKPAANHKDYLEWMLRSNFAPDTKQIIHQILKGEI